MNVRYSAPWRALRRLKLLLRVCLGKDIYPTLDIDADYEVYGAGYGEWRLLPALLDETSIIYSCGVGTDISFDLALIASRGCVVHAFDPTPKVRDWIGTQRLPNEFTFHAVGLSDDDTELYFNVPTDPAHVSHSVSGWAGANGKERIVMPVKSLRTIMSALEHTHIDLLKMDIEGSEYVVIQNLLESPIRPTQILVEFHHRWETIGVERSRECINALRIAGYKIFAISESGEEYSFVHQPGST